MRLRLLAPRGTCGAAALYNRRMVAALCALGNDAVLVELTGRYPATEADPADLPALQALPADAVLLLDGLALPVHTALPHLASGLIHHPSPLHADSAGMDRTVLHNAELAAMAALQRLVATSASCAAKLASEYHVPADRLTVVAAGVDEVPRNLPRRIGPCHILTLGPLVPRRRHDVLLAALIELADLNWQLTVVGTQDRDPAYAASLRALAEATGAGNRLRIADPAAPVPWDSVDIFALANPVSGQSGALAEALRRGLPVALCSNEAGLCPPGAGVMCSPDDGVTLSKSLRRMIFDAAMRADMAEAAFAAGRALPGWDQQARLLITALA